MGLLGGGAFSYGRGNPVWCSGLGPNLVLEKDGVEQEVELRGHRERLLHLELEVLPYLQKPNTR